MMRYKISKTSTTENNNEEEKYLCLPYLQGWEKGGGGKKGERRYLLF